MTHSPDQPGESGLEATDGAASARKPAPSKALSPAARRALAEAEARRRAAADAQREQPLEIGGRGGEEPVRYGDWEVKGIATDF